MENNTPGTGFIIFQKVQLFHFQERDDVILQIHEQLDEIEKINWSIEGNVAICPIVDQIEQHEVIPRSEIVQKRRLTKSRDSTCIG